LVFVKTSAGVQMILSRTKVSQFKNLTFSWFKPLIAGLVVLSGAGVQAQVCSNPGHDGPTYSSNAYFPGTGTAVSGQKIVTVGTVRVDANASSTALAAGDQVFIIQMQDAVINNANSISYGDGATGRGQTDIRNSGRYEFAVLASVSGGTLTMRDNLVNSYASAAATTSATRRSFQVLRVPQLSTVTLSGTINVTAWNGSTGGVYVLDVAGNLNMGGATINASQIGFRGGGGKQGSELVPGGSDWATAAAATASNLGAVKGEGIAGTPKLVRGPGNAPYNGVSSGLVSDLGYPNSLDQSRGAPGNAGGGGTSHNAGGGGGSNAGAGGKGGYSYARYSLTGSGTASCTTVYRTLTSGTTTYYACDGDQARDVGGLPGMEVAPNAVRLLAGGGGGAGDSNNSSDNSGVIQNSGGNGGGIIFIRAATISGSGTLLANGQDGLPGGRDGSGGGGAGGTIAIASSSTNLSGVIARANGGAGGRTGLPLTGAETQGSGGAGGGGAIIKPITMTLGTAETNGGTPGLNVPANIGGVEISNVYGSTSSGGGVANLVFDNTGVQQPGTCVPNISISKVTTTPSRVQGVDLSATYTITVSNTGNATAQGVQVQDALPSPFTYASTTTITATGLTRTSTTNPTAASANPLWSAWDVPAGQNLVIQFSATINAATPAVYQNSATVTYLDPLRTVATTTISATYNGNLAANTGEDVTITPAADLVVTKTDGITSIQGLALTTYTITVKNNGPSAVTNAAFKDPVAANMVKTAVSCSSSSGCPTAANVTIALLESGTGILVDLTNGQTLTFTITVALTTATVGATVTNTATISPPAGTTDPSTAAGSENTISDTDTVASLPPTLSGNVYFDSDHSSSLSVGEIGISGVTITLQPAAGPNITLTTNASGVYTSNVAPNMAYTILETDLAGYISTTPNTLNVTVVNSNIGQQDFFDYRGSKITGTVFRDDGYGNSLNTLTANDALQNNLEPGITGVAITVQSSSSTIDAALTDVNGNYTLWIPFGSSSSLNLTESLNQSAATGNNIANSSVYKAANLTDINASSFPIAFTSGQVLTGYNFGQVPLSVLQPNRTGSITSPGTATYTHLYRPGTLGVVNLAVVSSAGYTVQYALDTDCDGVISAAEHAVVITSFNVNQNWLRDANGRLQSCALEANIIVPPGRPVNEQDLSTIRASLVWANSSVIDLRSVIDTTTIGNIGNLKLGKTVRNVTTGTVASTSNIGLPGQVLEYCIDYNNLGFTSVSNVIVRDPVPFFTTYVLGSITLNGASLTDATDADLGEIVASIVIVRVGTVNPGSTGLVCYRTTIK
jgi:uncharacterized repeat protein (TIGR01451 family)